MKWIRTIWQLTSRFKRIVALPFSLSQFILFKETIYTFFRKKYKFEPFIEKEHVLYSNISNKKMN
ncbi:MAG: hypothetical protein JWR54_2404 [Mucilaginibacter sp.]|nr:hypothetical protein [Mucilaginibacter sp.]